MEHYGLIGYPVSHSRSADYFGKKFLREHIDATYQLLELEDVAALRSLVLDKDLSGLNVTIPHKIDVLGQLDSVSPEVADIGAANVIKVFREEKNIHLRGYNTDALGFEASIKPLLAGRRHALVFGSGGASRAVCYALRRLGVEYVVVSRSARSVGQIGYQDVTSDIIASTPLLVNATPLGMKGEREGMAVDIDYDAIGGGHLVYDLVYTPAPTLFLRRAAERGATTVDGNAMFLAQAEATWHIWQNAKL